MSNLFAKANAASNKRISEQMGVCTCGIVVIVGRIAEMRPLAPDTSGIRNQRSADGLDSSTPRICAMGTAIAVTVARGEKKIFVVLLGSAKKVKDEGSKNS